jgi:hypothetical protein
MSYVEILNYRMDTAEKCKFPEQDLLWYQNWTYAYNNNGGGYWYRS